MLYIFADDRAVAEHSVQAFFKHLGMNLYNKGMKTIVKDALNGFKIYIERVSTEFVT